MVVRKGAPNKEHAVVRDDALGRFPQGGETETSTGAGIGPGHKDASFVEFAVPSGENILDAGTDSGTHARMGIDTRGKFEHGGTEKSPVARLDIAGDDDDHGHQSSGSFSARGAASRWSKVLILSIMLGITAC